MANLDGFLNAPGVLIGEISGGSSMPPVIQPKTITENGTYHAPSGVDGFSPVIVNVPGITPSGTKNITTNGDHDVTQYENVHVEVVPDIYEGATNVTPKANERTVLDTTGKYMLQDITVFEVPYFQVSNPQGGNTAYIAMNTEVN